MTDLEKAARMALEALEGFIPYLPLDDEEQCGRYDKAIAALRQALEQQAQQEPVAYCNNTAIERLRNEPGDWMLIYGRPQHPHTVPLYARPQAREPLTDEQIAKALAAAKLLPEDYREDGQIEPLVRAIEAAHGITSGEATLGEKK